MKFSCPKCAAKYQIADEKVAGRTVKMKCRKCGATIPIRAEPTAQDLARAPIVRADSLKPVPRAGGTQGPSSTRAIAPAPSMIPVPPSVEWHAGIDGESVGPMSIREIERRIGEGSINAETFVWREGMDGWKQVPEVSEIAPILTRSIRQPLVPPPSMPAPAKAQRMGQPDRRGASPIRPVAPGAVASPAAVAPGAVASPAAGVPPSSGSPVASNPVIHETPAPAGWGGAMEGLGDSKPGAKMEAPVPHIDPQWSTESVRGGMRPSHESLLMQLRKKRKSTWVIPFAIVAALVFGVTIGFVMFGDQETKIVKQIIEVPAKVGEAIDTKKNHELADSIPPPEDDAEGPSASKQVGSAPKTGASATSGNREPKAAEVKGLSGLSGLDGLGGPTAGPSGPSSSRGGGEPLSSSQIQSTVSTYLTGVKRGCWERALMTRDKNAPSSARVSVAITVAPSGNVTGATSGGDPKGYAGLSSCITQRVRGWTFPRSSGQTTVNVPFVFAAQ